LSGLNSQYQISVGKKVEKKQLLTFDRLLIMFDFVYKPIKSFTKHRKKRNY